MSDHIADRDQALESLVGKVADEFTERVQRGEGPDVEEYARRHPDIAEVLRQVLPALQVLGSSPLATSGVPSSAAILGELGDFRIVRELGRGGMGVVYEAEQISLCRQVALKVLPFAATMDPRHLQRFQHEARAAALLHHAHIVPVFAVGCERGVHYYAMQYIEGQDLASVIRQLRDPAPVTPAAPTATTLRLAVTGLPTEGSVQGLPHFQAIARLGFQAAEALEHAHGLGIVHRDIKPGNLLVNAHGHLWVTDFGLAQIHSDAQMTRTGDLLGTLRYMSPEQALARRGLVDQRTDVYALGATLYELLTQQPVFGGHDRQELLKQIAFEEPRKPRQWNPAIPAELETIVLKALAKELAERYATARELADDLQRWLVGQPIQARPMSWPERSWRWCRRNRHIATLTGLVVVLLIAGVIGLAISSGLLWQQKDRAEQALTEMERQTRLAKERAARLRERLYVAEMGSAFKHWQSGEMTEVASLLASYEPHGTDEDLRGFEWYYLRNLVRTTPRERLVYTGHTKIVYCAVFSRDGKTVASTGQDKTIQIWDAATGKTLATLADHKHGVSYLAHSQDGHTLASAAEDGNVWLWDLKTNTPRKLPLRHHKDVLCVQFAPDGKKLVSGGEDGFIRVWDVDNLNVEIDWRAHAEGHWITAVVFSRDGKKLASVSHDHTVKVWDLKSREVLYTLQGGGPMIDVAFSPDDSLLTTTDKTGQVRLWNTKTKEQKTLGKHIGVARCACFSPDGKMLASSGDDGRVRLWSVENGVLLSHFRAHPSIIWCVQFSPDGKSLSTASSDHTVKIWSLADDGFHGQEFAVPSGDVRHLAFNAIDRTVAVSMTGGNIAVLDAAPGSVFRPLPIRTTTGSPAPIAFSPDGCLLAFVDAGGKAVNLWDLKNNRDRPVGGGLVVPLKGAEPLPEVEWVNAVAFTPDGKHLLARRTGGAVKAWDLAGKRWQVWAQTDFAFSGILVATSDHDGLAVQVGPKSLRLWDWKANKWRGEMVDYPLAISSLSCAPDGRTMAVGGSDGSLLLTEGFSAQIKARLPGHMGGMPDMAFSPDGRTLASCDDRRVRLWHVRTGLELFSFEVPGKLVSTLAFSPDGKSLAAAGRPQTGGTNVWLWYAAIDRGK